MSDMLDIILILFFNIFIIMSHSGVPMSEFSGVGEDFETQQAILNSILSEEQRKLDDTFRNKKLEEDRELRRQQDEDLIKCLEKDRELHRQQDEDLLKCLEKDREIEEKPLSREDLRKLRLQYFNK